MVCLCVSPIQTIGDIMLEAFQLMCFGSVGLFAVGGFVVYQFLKLPLIANVVYLRLGGDVVKDVVDTVVSAKNATNNDLTVIITEVVNQLQANNNVTT